MLKNYIKIAWRNMVKRKFFAALNILCLALGLTFSLLIGVYIFKELKVDTDLAHINDQYLLKSEWKTKDMGLDITMIGSLPKRLKDVYPNLVANYYRNVPVTNVISYNDKHFKEEIAIGDTSMVRMFGFSLLYGNPQQAFLNSSSAVITEELAMRLFGTVNAIGKTFEMGTTVKDTQQSFTVSAVLRSAPDNSVVSLLGDRYTVFVPNIGNRYFPNNPDPTEGWAEFNTLGYIQLQPGVRPEQIEQPIKDLVKKNTPEWVQQNLTVTPAALKTYYLDQGSKKTMLWSLGLIACFILIMGVVNYININIGVSAYRLKEIGLRKVFGVERQQLIGQFVLESLVITLFSAVIAICAYELLRGYFGNLLSAELSHFWEFNWQIRIWFGLLIIAVTFLSGLYPAFVLSASRITLAVKGEGKSSYSGALQRKLLIGVQFTLAVIVFAVAITVSNQMKYTLSKDLGYNRDNLIVINAFPKQWDADGVKKMENIKEGLKELAGIKDASLSFEVPDRKPPGTIELTNIGHTQKSVFLPVTLADKDYAATFGMKMLAGSFFAQGPASIPNQLVINEAALKLLGLSPQNAVGKQLNVQGGAPLTICGVVKNYNYSSLQDKIEPVCFVNITDNLAFRFLSVKINGNPAVMLTQIQKKWKEMNPQAPFEYKFMEDRFSSLYLSEMQLKNATTLGTILNMLIIFLGIFGVVAFTLAKRNKEIAIRKVLGADLKSIVQIIISDYVFIIVLAVIVGSPIAYGISQKWLMGYAYKIDQSVWSYLMVPAVMFAVVVLLVILQTAKAAAANPVKALRNE